MSKEATVIVLDVGSGTAKQLEEGGKAAIKMFLQQKLMFRKSDEVGIVLLGHTETRNVLADEGYEHVFVARDITKPGLEMLHEVCVPSLLRASLRSHHAAVGWWVLMSFNNAPLCGPM